MNTRHYDVVIAGAGPAGCAAAIALANTGCSICLVHNHNNENLIPGESIPGAVIRLLRRLNISDLSSLIDLADFKTCKGNTSAWNTDQWIFKDALYNPEGGGWHINRVRFNEGLRKKAAHAGAVMQMGKLTQVFKLAIDASNKTKYLIKLIDEKQGHHYITADWLIDATGRSNCLSRQLKIPNHRIDSQIAAVCWLKTNETNSDYLTRIKSVSSGWWYTALLPDHNRVINFYGLATQIRSFLECPELFFRSFNEASIIPVVVNESMKICFQTNNAGTVRSEMATTENMIAVGDAVLSMDPICSQGIYFALYSAIKASEAILSILHAGVPRKAAFFTYQSQVDSVFHSVQRSRKYIYHSESRYLHELYWQRARL